MKQQTAIDWLWEISQEREIDAFDFLKAKAMEKNQIIQSSRISYLAGQEYHMVKGLSKQFAEQYYNENYNK